jgi:hypothetical protein
MGWVVKATARSLYPREKPGTHFIRGWVAPRAVRKISSLRGFLHRFINLFYWLRFLWVSSVQENGGITVHKQYDWCLAYSFDDTVRNHSWSGYKPGGQCDLCRHAELPAAGHNTYPSSLGALLQQNDIRTVVTVSHLQRMISIIVTCRYIDTETSAKTKPIEKF